MLKSLVRNTLDHGDQSCQERKEEMKYLIILGIFIIGVLSWNDRQKNIISISNGENIQVSFIDDIFDAVKGHIEDIEDRQKDDSFINGEIESNWKFKYTKDSIHWAEGSAEIVNHNGTKFIQLLSDFDSGLAPDLYIFTSSDIIKTQEDLDKTKKQNLRKLIKGSGASFYQIDNSDIKSIVIWCKRFNQFMGSAIIQ